MTSLIHSRFLFAAPLAAALFAACASPGAGPQPQPPAEASSPAADVEAFMWAYTEAWNRHDAATIARDFYRLGPDVATQAASLEQQFEALRAQGYVRSDIHSVEGCRLNDGQAIAEMRFTRLTTSGEPLPPRDRASVYLLRRFPEGWRITSLIGMEASADIACTSRAG